MILCHNRKLITVPCCWCIADKKKKAQAQLEILFEHRFVRYQGFHCEEHAEQMHDFFKIDASMRYSCCEQVQEDDLTACSITAQASQNDD